MGILINGEMIWTISVAMLQNVIYGLASIMVQSTLEEPLQHRQLHTMMGLVTKTHKQPDGTETIANALPAEMNGR